jgi:riboflavin synthase
MFTGLIEEVGEVLRIETVPHGSRLTFGARKVIGGLRDGDSVAIDGVCLTALETDRNSFKADISPETIARTSMSYYALGTKVNLERPLAVGQRLGGHFVQGHVDGIVKVLGAVNEGDFLRMRFSLPDSLRPLLVEKGSVALNGVSLTVASLEPDGFDVQLIPHTLEMTNLGASDRAEAVNLEVDILGKYVAQLLDGRLRQLAGGEEGNVSTADGHGAGSTLGLDRLIQLPGD